MVHILHFEKLGVEDIESRFSDLLKAGISETSLRYLQRENSGFIVVIREYKICTCVWLMLIKTLSHGCFEMKHSQSHKTSLETLCNKIDNVIKLTTVPYIELP